MRSDSDKVLDSVTMLILILKMPTCKTCSSKQSQILFLLLVVLPLSWLSCRLRHIGGSLPSSVGMMEVDWMQKCGGRSMHVLNRSSACLVCPVTARRVNG